MKILRPLIALLIVVICLSCNKSDNISNKDNFSAKIPSIEAQSKSYPVNNTLIGLWEGTEDGKDLQTKNKNLKKIQKELLSDLSKEVQIAFKENNEFDIIMIGMRDSGIYTLDQNNGIIQLKSINGNFEMQYKGNEIWFDLGYDQKMKLQKISDDYTKIRKEKKNSIYSALSDALPNVGIYDTWEFVDLLPESGSTHDGLELMKSLEMSSTLTFNDNKSFTKKRNNTLIKGTFRADSENIYINMESGKSEKYKVVSLTLNELKLKDSELNAIRIYKRVE